MAEKIEKILNSLQTRVCNIFAAYIYCFENRKDATKTLVLEKVSGRQTQ